MKSHFISLSFASLFALLLSGCDNAERLQLHKNVAANEAHITTLQTDMQKALASVSQLNQAVQDLQNKQSASDIQIATLKRSSDAYEKQFLSIEKQFLTTEKQLSEQIARVALFEKLLSDQNQQRKSEGLEKKGADKRERLSQVMRAVQAVRGAINTGVTRIRYSELVSTARATYSDASLEIGEHPFLPRLDAYITFLQQISTHWNNAPRGMDDETLSKVMAATEKDWTKIEEYWRQIR